MFLGMGSVFGLVSSELFFDVHPYSLLLLLQCMTSYLNNNVLHSQHGAISDALKVSSTTLLSYMYHNI